MVKKELSKKENPLIYYSWSWALGSDQKNSTADTFRWINSLRRLAGNSFRNTELLFPCVKEKPYDVVQVSNQDSSRETSLEDLRVDLEFQGWYLSGPACLWIPQEEQETIRLTKVLLVAGKIHMEYPD